MAVPVNVPRLGLEAPRTVFTSDPRINSPIGKMAEMLEMRERFLREQSETERKNLASEGIAGREHQLGVDRLGFDRNKQAQQHELDVQSGQREESAEQRLQRGADEEALRRMIELDPAYQQPYAQATGIYDPGGVEQVDQLLGTQQGGGATISDEDLLGEQPVQPPVAQATPQQATPLAPPIQQDDADMAFSPGGVGIQEPAPTQQPPPIVEDDALVVSGEMHDQPTPPGIPTRFGRIDTAGVRAGNDAARKQWAEGFLRGQGVPEHQIPALMENALQYGRTYDFDDEKAADAFRDDVKDKQALDAAKQRAEIMAGSSAARARASRRSGDRLERTSALAEYHKQTPEKDIRNDVQASTNLETGIRAVHAAMTEGRAPDPATYQGVLSSLVKLNDPRISNQDVLLAEGSGNRISILAAWQDWIANRGQGEISPRQFNNLLNETKRVFDDSQARIQSRYEASQGYRDSYRDMPDVAGAIDRSIDATYAGWAGHKPKREKPAGGGRRAPAPAAAPPPVKHDVMTMTPEDVDNMTLEELKAAGLLD